LVLCFIVRRICISFGFREEILKKPLEILRLFFKHKVPWWMRIVRPLVLSCAILLGIDKLLLPSLPGRPLTPGEKTMLTEVFHESVDYNKIRIHHSKFGDAVRVALRAGAVTRGNLIIENDDTPDYSAKDVPFFPRYQFTHEMTHVWQNQNHVSDSFFRVSKRAAAHVNPVDNQLATYTYSLKGARDLTDFTIEQQASIVPDYNFLVKPEAVFKKNVQSPLDADTFKTPEERKAAYESVLKNFLANPLYPRHR
jgi:hypothetical protein